MQIKGTVKRSSLEGGVWTLVSDNGETYHINNEKLNISDGQKIEASGTVEENMMGIGMMGPIFTIESFKKQ